MQALKWWIASMRISVQVSLAKTRRLQAFGRTVTPLGPEQS
jgi:hypothetical protein